VKFGCHNRGEMMTNNKSDIEYRIKKHNEERGRLLRESLLASGMTTRKVLY